jgi:hypothetical protein
LNCPFLFILIFYRPHECAITEAGRELVVSPEGCAEKVVPGPRAPCNTSSSKTRYGHTGANNLRLIASKMLELRVTLFLHSKREGRGYC